MHEFEAVTEKKSKKWALILFGSVLIVFCLLFYKFLFSAPSSASSLENFTVPLSMDRGEALGKLENSGFVRSATVARLVIGVDTISPGGYKLSKNMNVFQVAKILKQEPYMKWIVIREGLRKEEIAELLEGSLSWTEEDKNAWLNVETEKDADYREGVYFPDTYLIPIDETPSAVASRMRRRFEEKFGEYSEEARRQNIRWPTVIKLASLIQREAAGKADMDLISGVLWNRLLTDMKLDIDATLQYIKGNEEIGWWPKVRPEDKLIDSPYNTYKYKELPPTPIANPGIDAIKAVLYPEDTECLYYLHDRNKEIHCAKSYADHKKNIDTYLK